MSRRPVDWLTEASVTDFMIFANKIPLQMFRSPARFAGPPRQFVAELIKFANQILPQMSRPLARSLFLHLVLLVFPGAEYRLSDAPSKATLRLDLLASFPEVARHLATDDCVLLCLLCLFLVLLVFLGEIAGIAFALCSVLHKFGLKCGVCGGHTECSGHHWA